MDMFLNSGLSQELSENNFQLLGTRPESPLLQKVFATFDPFCKSLVLVLANCDSIAENQPLWASALGKSF